MSPLDNPFTPSFGRIPPYMAGRSALVGDFAQAFDGNGNDPYLQTVFSGARGTGKTALLSYIADLAAQRGWVSANVSCVDGMLEDILEQAAAAASEFIEASPPVRLKGITIGGAIGAEWEHADTSPANWRTRMNALLDGLAEQGIGLLITVDEVNVKLSEMTLLASVYQHFVREGRRVALLMAGLPHRISQLVDDEPVSFLRRASKVELGCIPDYEIADAFAKTVRGAGGAVEDDALEACVAAIGGFPYMMQLVGFRAWNEGSDSISLKDARAGVSLASEDMKRQIIVPTWASLSTVDRKFCASVANGNVTAPQIAADLGKPPNYVSKYKQRLLDQGVIDQDLDGKLAFSLPGFAQYVRSIS